MNNIEILEDYLDKQDRKFVSEHRLMILQAVENIIAENKELKKQIPSPTNPIPIEYQTDIWVLKRDYISKSKVKEIIYGDYEDLEIILKIKKLVEGE